MLHQPEIPNNTGNIGRSCLALGAALHLIRPLGFETSVKALRRAGLDYWPRLRPREHESWEAFRKAEPDRPLWLLTTRASRPLFEVRLRPGDALVFGRETAGLPEDLLRRHPDRLVTLPMMPAERSLNLATAVCAALCEGVRQLIGSGDVTLDEQGRLVNLRNLG
ncbi:MAG: tRNA (cytidine(34)-2'-O)-methyltransferase [Phycisphaerales bacterium JB039]